MGCVEKKGSPPGRLTIHDANRLVAMLGGYAGRKGDGDPGPESLGAGLRRLMDITWGWHLRDKHLPHGGKRCV